MLTSESAISQLSSCSDVVFEPVVDFTPCTQLVATATRLSSRSLSYYLDCAENFLQQEETLTKEERKELKKRSEASFVDNCLKIKTLWDNLPQILQDQLKDFPMPSYLPLSGAVNLLKVPVDALPICLTQLKNSAHEQGYLHSKDVSAIAKLFHIKPKRNLVRGEEMTADGWELMAKRYKLNPENLVAIKQKAQEKALHKTVCTEHAVEALTEFGYDELLILPKAKKIYTERDLNKVIQIKVALEQENTSIKQENTILKERLQELQELKDQEAILIQEKATQVEPYLETEEQFVQDSELQVPHSVIEPDEVTPTALEIDNTETLPQITSLKDLKGYKAIASFNGEWKSGSLGSQNGTKHTVQFKNAEDYKIYTFDFSKIQVEIGDRFRPLDEIIEELDLTVEERNAEQIRLDIEKKKAQTEVKTSSKGFGFSSNTKPSSRHKSLLNTKGFAPSPMGKKSGMR